MLRWLLPLLLLPALAGADPFRTRTIVTYGDSIVRFNDDNPVPPNNTCDQVNGEYVCASPQWPNEDFIDGCAAPGKFCYSGLGLVLMNEYGLGLGLDYANLKANGGMNLVTHPFDPTYPGEGNVFEGRFDYKVVPHEHPWSQWILMSLHVNDCGSQPASSLRNAAKTIVDRWKDLSGAHIFFYRSPGSVGKQVGGGSSQTCDTGAFDGGPDSLRDLFLGTEPGEYGNVANVHYTEEFYRLFDANRAEWFAFDPVDQQAGTGSPYLHINGEGGAALALYVCEWLAEATGLDLLASPGPNIPGTPTTSGDWTFTQTRCNTRPAAPSITFVSADADSISVLVGLGSDPDNDPVTGYVWAADVGEEPGAYPSHDRTRQLDIAGNADNCRTPGCVATDADPAGADGTGTECGGADCDWVADKWLVASDGIITIEGLSPGTSYTITGYTWDGKVASPFTTTVEATSASAQRINGDMRDVGQWICRACDDPFWWPFD